MDAWITVVVLCVMGAAMARDRVSPTAGVVGATISLYVLGVITPRQAFAGFSNPAPVTIGLLYIAARAIEKTNALTPVLSRLLSTSGGLRKTLSRLLIPVSAASGFFSNTPIVAMLIDPVVRWSDEQNVPGSKILIPISYAAILGGGVTLIGTSTNLLVSGLLEESGDEALGMFELAPIGLPAAVFGLVVMLAVAPIALPVRHKAGHGDGGTTNDYVVRFRVVGRTEDDKPGSLVGRRLSDTRLLLPSTVSLMSLDRAGQRIEDGENVELRRGDGLTFLAAADDIVALKSHDGLVGEQHRLLGGEEARTSFFEAVISATSPLVGRTLADSDFRHNVGGVVVAIHRSGSNISGPLDRVSLHHGDALLLIADDGFRQRWRDRGLFLLVARVDLGLPTALDPEAPHDELESSSADDPRFGMPDVRMPQALIAGMVMAAIVILPVISGGSFSVLRSAALGVLALVMLRIITPSEVGDAVDVGVVVMIAAAFGLGSAVESTGLAESLANGIIGLVGPFGDVGLIVGLVIATSLLTELVTNSAAIVLIFPIVQSVAMQQGLDNRTLAIAVAVAASSSFLTPIGYQTNTMVYGPGGYQFVDYLRLGVPVMTAALLAIVTMALVLA